MKNNGKHLSSKILILGFFAVLILLIILPFTFLQTTRGQKAKEQTTKPTPTSSYFTPGKGVIAGYVYFDQDKDGERGNDEKPLKEITVHVKQIHKQEKKQLTMLTTDSQGYFRVRYSLHPSNPTSFAVSVIVPDGYETTNANPIIITDLRPGRDRIIEFGLFTTQTVPTNIQAVTPTITKKPTKTSTPTL